MWGSPAPLCVPPQIPQQPQCVLYATGGSTARSRRGSPLRMGGWSYMRGGESATGGAVKGPCDPLHLHMAGLQERSGVRQRRVGRGPWEVLRVMLSLGSDSAWGEW